MHSLGEAQHIANTLEIGDLLINEKGHPMFVEKKGRRRRFQCTTARSNKYWEIEVRGNQFITYWGKIGSPATSNAKQCFSEVRAKL